MQYATYRMTSWIIRTGKSLIIIWTSVGSNFSCDYDYFQHAINGDSLQIQVGNYRPLQTENRRRGNAVASRYTVYPLLWPLMLGMQSNNSEIKRFELHLSELQRVMVAFPVFPVHPVSVRGVAAVQVKTVQVGLMTPLIPPATFERHCTWVWPRIIVLVSSAELVSAMTTYWITFKHRRTLF